MTSEMETLVSDIISGYADLITHVLPITAGIALVNMAVKYLYSAFCGRVPMLGGRPND